MKICLLDCSAPFLIDEKVFPPLGLMAVGTALYLQGHDVVIKDSPDDSHYFGLGPTTPEYPDALDKLVQIKNRDSDCRVIIGGPHAGTNVAQCLVDGFDAVVTGDGENTTIDTFRAQGQVGLPIKPLDEYPTVDRSLLNIRKYRYLINERATTTMVTSRGCPYLCGFCAKIERGARYRSPESIETEIDYIHNELGYRALMFFDDILIMKRKRTIQICKTLKEYGILWRCFVRGDLVVRHGQDQLDRMRGSGCTEVGIGIESGSDKILAAINKGEDVAILRKAIAMLHHAGIRVKGFIIVGLPGEDRDSLSETRRFLEEVELDDVDFAVYQPYRGSPIWDNRQGYDITWDTLPTNIRFYKGKPGKCQCVVRTSALTSNEILKARDELEKEFKCP